MTTPVLPVFVDDFTRANSSSWGSEWTPLSASGIPTGAFTITENTGKINPSGVATYSSSKLLYAQRWKDPACAGFELSATMTQNSTSSSGWGILFNWDGTMDSPNGYMLAITKLNALTLLEFTEGVVTTLTSLAVTLVGPQKINLRVSTSGTTNLIQFQVGDAFNNLGAGNWTTTTDSTRLTGYVGIAFQTNATSSSTIPVTDSIVIDDLRISRIGTGAGQTVAGVNVSGAPTIRVLASGGSTVDSASQSFSAVGTPNLGPKLYVLAIVTSAVAGETHTISGGGLTGWTQHGFFLYNASSRRVALFSTYGTFNGSNIVIVGSSGGTFSGIVYWFAEISGAADGSATTLPVANLAAINSAVTSTGTAATTSTSLTPIATLPSVSPHVLAIMAVGSTGAGSGATFTPGAFVTELFDQAISTPNSCLGIFSISSPSAPVTLAVTHASLVRGAVAIVIQPSIDYGPINGDSASWGGVS